MKLLLGKRALRRNDKKPVDGVGGEFYYVNGISVAQGPNYGAYNKEKSLGFRALINTVCSYQTTLSSTSSLQPWPNECNTGAPSSPEAKVASSPPTSPPPPPQSPSSKTVPLHGPTKACPTSNPTKSLLPKLPTRSCLPFFSMI